MDLLGSCICWIVNIGSSWMRWEVAGWNWQLKAIVGGCGLLLEVGFARGQEFRSELLHSTVERRLNWINMLLQTVSSKGATKTGS